MSGGRSGSRGDYEVGYGKPPKETRFRKGTSGNPRGRPKGAKSLRRRLEQALEETVEVREGDRVRKMSRFDVMVRAAVGRGMKGDPRAAAEIRRLMNAAGLFAGGEAEAAQGGVVALPVGNLSEEQFERYIADYKYPALPDEGEDL